MEQKLQEALTAVRDGETEKARVMLAEFLSEHPDNVPSWLLLSKLATSDVQRAAFLRKVLELDPDHAYALGELAHMGATPSPSAGAPEQEEPETSATATAPEDAEATYAAVEATSRGEDLPVEAAPDAPGVEDDEELLPAFLARERETDDLEAVVQDDVIASLVAEAEAEAEAMAAPEEGGTEEVEAEEAAAEASTAGAEEDATGADDVLIEFAAAADTAEAAEVDEEAEVPQEADADDLLLALEAASAAEDVDEFDEEAAPLETEEEVAAELAAEEEITEAETASTEAEEAPGLAESPTEPYIPVPVDAEADAETAPWMVEDESLLDLEGWEAAPEPMSAEETTPDAMRQLLPDDDTVWPEDEKVKGPLPDEDFSVKEEIAAMEKERKLEAAMAAGRQQREQQGDGGQPGWLLPALATLTLLVFLLLVYAVITLL